MFFFSFGSHIISTPWQQSWVTMDTLEASYQNLGETEELNEESLGTAEMCVLRREIDFQYILRNYSSDPFVQVSSFLKLIMSIF